MSDDAPIAIALVPARESVEGIIQSTWRKIYARCYCAAHKKKRIPLSYI
jgi:hypothetical protein